MVKIQPKTEKELSPPPSSDEVQLKTLEKNPLIQIFQDYFPPLVLILILLIIIYFTTTQIINLIYNPAPTTQQTTTHLTPTQQEMQGYNHKLFTNPALAYTLTLASSSRTNLLTLPSPNPSITNIITQTALLSTRDRTDSYLLGHTIHTTQHLSQLILFDIRQEILNLSPESRPLFLNNHLKEIKQTLEKSVTLRNTLQKMLEINSANYETTNTELQKYKQAYTQATENFSAPLAEQTARTYLQKVSQTNFLKQKHTLYSSALTRLTRHESILRKKSLAIEKNFHALVAGIQVTLIDNIDLGLINQEN